MLKTQNFLPPLLMRLPAPFPPKNAPLVSHQDTVFGPNSVDDFELPKEVPSFLEGMDLENYLGIDDIALWCALTLYNRRSGRTHRARDVSLAKNMAP